MNELLAVYGLPALFLSVMLESAGVPVPGETALIAASVLAARGILPLPSVIVVAAAAAIVGDNVGYWVGRLGGRPLLERWRSLARYTARLLPPTERFFANHGGKTVFLARFIAGLRVAGAFTAGAARMEWWRFFFWNVAGGVAWATSIALVTYFLGQVAASTIVSYGFVGAVVVLAAGVIVYIVVRRLHRANIDRP